MTQRSHNQPVVDPAFAAGALNCYVTPPLSYALLCTEFISCSGFIRKNDLGPLKQEVMVQFPVRAQVQVLGSVSRRGHAGGC